MKYKTEKVRISSDGEEMKMLILIPSDPARGSNRPGVLWIHGGRLHYWNVRNGLYVPREKPC